ncbi:MAG: hypothetical protein HOQ02_01190 [Lysobacter sp.]|nr:hypothetical protein [Lysobacter sp.]
MATIRTVRDHRDDGISTHTTSTTTYSFWWELGLGIAVSIGFILFACHRQAASAATTDVAPLTADPRNCAAAAVYTKATADDWLQRAAIAQASLNAFNASSTALGTCRKRAGAVLSGSRDTIRWRNALDAVDAVASGDFVLPPACLRATVVVPLPATQWPGAQCVVRDLVFAEGTPL